MQDKTFRTVPMASIHPPPEPLRITISAEKVKELADSLAVHGLLQPLVVKLVKGGYQIIAGHRRFLAASLLDWKEITCRVLPATTTDEGIISLVENVQRENLTPLEEARVIHTLVVEQERDVDTVARRFGKSRLWVDRRLEMLDWPQEILTAVHLDKVSLAVARELIRVKDDSYRKHLLDSASNNGATAMTARVWADEWERSHAYPGGPVTADPEPTIPYQGQTVGIACGGCGRLHPIQHLRTIYLCRPCVEPQTQVRQPAPQEIT